MKNLLALFLFVGMLNAAALADDSTNASKPGLTASRTLTVIAEVSAVDMATRQVTVKTEEGEMLTFDVSEDVRNLGQVEAGDFVIAEIFQQVDIQVHANPDGVQPSASAVAAADRAAEGAMPAGAIGASVTLTALVTAIDLEANTFTLRGPAGNEMTFQAQNPDNLRRSEVGDLVVINITQSLGVLVERPETD